MYFVRWYECNWRYHWAGSKCVSFWFVGLGLVDCPTQLICTWIFICWVGGGYSIQGVVKCLSPYFTQDWAFLTNFFAKYTCHWNKWELEAKNWFIEVQNMPKKRSFLKSFHKRASLKSGIPEMCHLKSRIPEMGQLNSGIPELSYHKLRIPEMSQLNSGIPEMCYLIWAGTFREFWTCGSTFNEFLNWAGLFWDFLICGGTFQEFMIWGLPF